jgi:hypothetical protein
MARRVMQQRTNRPNGAHMKGALPSLSTGFYAGRSRAISLSSTRPNSTSLSTSLLRKRSASLCPKSCSSACFKPASGTVRTSENDTVETDCVAGHVRFELRNVVANYPFEKPRRFAAIQPNFGHGDHSRLSCGVRDTQLGAGFCRDLRRRWP